MLSDYKIHNIRIATQWKLFYLLDHLNWKIKQVDTDTAKLIKTEIDIIKRILNLKPVTKKEYQKVMSSKYAPKN